MKGREFGLSYETWAVASAHRRAALPRDRRGVEVGRDRVRRRAGRQYRPCRSKTIRSRMTTGGRGRRRGSGRPTMNPSLGRCQSEQGGSAEECWRGDGRGLRKEYWAVLGLSSSSALLHSIEEDLKKE